MQWVASSDGSEEFRYLAGIITSVSTLSPYLKTVPFAFILVSSYNPSSAGAEIFPVMALAAATAGLARYTSESTCPMRPTKFRLVVEIHLSPAARIPMYPPRHGPQVGVLTTAPASIKDLQKPFPHCLQVNSLCCRDHDAANLSLLFLPLKISAAQRRSSIRPLVQEPMTDWSITTSLFDLINGLCVFRKMRECNGRLQLAKINGVFLLINRIRICFIFYKRTAAVLFSYKLLSAHPQEKYYFFLRLRWPCWQW